MTQTVHNSHAGEILKREFLEPINISQNELGRQLKVPENRIHAIVNGQRRITADTDLRLCKFFNLSEGYFLRLQNTYETTEAKRNIKEILPLITAYTPNNQTENRPSL